MELFKSAYSDEMLARYAGKIKAWRGNGLTVWMFFNNDWYTNAIQNAASLEKMLS